MRGRILMTNGVWASVLLMAGCGGKVLYPHYYALDIPAAPIAAEAGARQPVTLAVRRFEAASYLRQGRIVYRPTPTEIGFYDYHRWAADPAEAITEATIDSIRSRRLFAFVKPYDGQGREDYLLSGRLEKLEEIDSPRGVRVAARLSAELVDLSTGAAVWQSEGDEAAVVESRDVNSLVGAMSHAVQKCIERLTDGLDRHFSAKLEAAK